MQSQDPFPDFPRDFEVPGRTGSVRYERWPGRYAVHGGEGISQAGGREVDVLHEDGNIIHVYEGECPEKITGAKALTPVYRITPQGPLAIPTGRVFLRLSEGKSLSDQRDQIQSAGFGIESIPPYAPHAGWLAPLSRQISDALREFSKLQEVPDAEGVEPQMLMRSEKR